MINEQTVKNRNDNSMRKCVVLLTNFMTPYRKATYNTLHKYFKKNGVRFKVLVMSKCDPGFDWNYDDLKIDASVLLREKSYVLKSRCYKVVINPELKRTLLKLRPDVLIISGDYLALSCWRALALKRKMGYKLYFWSESHLNEERNYSNLVFRIRDYIRHLFYNSTDGFIYPGKKALQFIQYYRTKAKSKTDYVQYPNLIENGAYSNDHEDELDRDACRKEFDICENRFVFSCVARLEWEKGLYEFLSLLAKCKNRQSVTLLIAGKGEEHGRLEKMARENKLDVRFLGYRTRDEIMRMHKAADCFLLPSLSDPNPLAVIEAMWCAKPLLVSMHVGNYPETVCEGENGFVIDYKNESEAIKKIETMISADDTWIRNAGDLSLKNAKERFDVYKESQRLADYFSKIAAT